MRLAEGANRNSLCALIVAIVAAVWLLYAAIAKQVPPWSFLLPLPLIVAAGRWYGKNRDKWLRLIRLRKYHERGIVRMEEARGSGFTGEEFRIAHHVYDVDLQVLGEGSLFELMCTARTGLGRRRAGRLPAQVMRNCRGESAPGSDTRTGSAGRSAGAY